MPNFQNVFPKYFRVVGSMASPSAVVTERHYRGRWALAYAMAEMGCRVGVEVGTQYGDSAKMWCTANPNLHLTCVDPYLTYRKRRSQRHMDSEYAKACENLSPYNVTILRKKSLEVVDDFADESLDFINIDGDHTFDPCTQDIIRWVPKIRKGGLILVHDYMNPRWIDVTTSVNAYIYAHRIDPWYFTPDVSPTAFWERGAERQIRT